MKKVLLLTLFCSSSLSSFSQVAHEYPNTAKIGINAGFFGNGDFYMPVTYIEYTRTLKPWIGITPRVMWGQANSQGASGFNVKSAHGASISASFTPFIKKLPGLKFHLGALYHKTETSHGWIPYPDINPYEVYNFQYYNNSGLGIFGSISYDIIDKNKIEGGLRLDMLTTFDKGYFNSESMQLGFYMGLKF